MTINRVEILWRSRKEKVLGVAVSKEGHADSLLGHEFFGGWEMQTIRKLKEKVWYVWISMF